MTDLTKTIAPKSDQLNSDDLIGGPIDIKITSVRILGEPDQPVAINYEGDAGKPYKPCKSMRRVLVNIWGGDGSTYAGRSMRLYRDPTVLFGGQPVGGIRISHMSHIDRDVTMALTASRASRKPFVVKPMQAAPQSRQEPRQQADRPSEPQTPREPAAPAGDVAERVNAVCSALAKASSQQEIDSVWNRAAGVRSACAGDAGLKQQLDDGKAAAERLLGQETF